MRVSLVLALTSTALADAPSWPAAGTTLDLTWVVHHEATKGPRASRVELVATLGAVERTTAIGEQYGGLSPLDQPMCAAASKKNGGPPPIALEPGEVAKLVFGGGVVRGFAVRRPKPDQLAIVAFDRGDDSCGKPTCPPAPVTTVAIPARVKTIKERIVLVDKAGKRTPFDCL